MVSSKLLKRALAGGACAMILASAAVAQSRDFNIPAGDLKAALDAYAKQTGAQLVYRTDDVRGSGTTGAHGKLEAEAALRKILGGTGLTVRRDRSGAIAIVREGGVTRISTQATEGAGAPESSQTVEEVVVTGSRLKTTVFDAPTPVVAVDRDDILEQGYMGLAEALEDMPGVVQASSLANNQTATQANGLSTVSLRGLGENRTLTLIDGHRTVSNVGNKNAVSLSSIPEFFVDRVEVTTGGASAVYGSDAIAGVVNIITEQKFQGLRARVVGGTTDAGGGESLEYSVGAGKRFLDDRLYVMAGATFDRQFILKATDRDFALQSLIYAPATNTVTAPDLSTNTPGGRFISGKWFYNDSGLHPNFVTATDGYEDRGRGTLITPRDTLNGAAKFSYDFSDNLKLWGQFLYSKVTTDSSREPYSFTNSTTYGVNDEFTVGRLSRTVNPFAPAEIKAAASSSGIDFRRRFVELGDTYTHNERETLRGWIGLEGHAFADWDWKLTYGYGEFDGLQVRGNTVNLQRLTWALDSEKTPAGVIQCRSAAARADGCVPMNIFGVNSVSADAANYVRANVWYHPQNRQDTIEGYVSGTAFNLPAGPVETAFGFESRRDKTRTTTDALIQNGFGSSSYIPEYSGVIKADEVFAEASFPILKDVPFAYRLSVDAAARFAKYNLDAVDTTTSYRIGAQWAPVKDLRFRSEYARAQRAPDTSELYSPPRDDADTVVDVCSGVTATTTGVVASNCRANPAIAAAIAAAADKTFRQTSTSIKAPNGGNANLHEETANTLTVGVVYSPSFVPGLTASVDYYDIKVADVISSLTNSALLAGCYSDPAGTSNDFCATITRDSSGQLVRILNQEQNLNAMRARGVDVAAGYRFDLQNWGVPGKFAAKLNYSRRLELSTEYNGITSVEVSEEVGEIGTAKHEAKGSLAWRGDHLNLQWSTRYIGKVVDSNERAAAAKAAGFADPLFLNVDAYWRHDISFKYTPDLRDPKLRIFGAVQNVFDQYGPFLPDGTDSGNAYNYSSIYGVTGRSFTLGLQLDF
jgi:outer membrane receptor protein involved in Fe transport